MSNEDRTEELKLIESFTKQPLRVIRKAVSEMQPDELTSILEWLDVGIERAEADNFGGKPWVEIYFDRLRQVRDIIRIRVELGA